jgi:hypothetical protein
MRTFFKILYFNSKKLLETILQLITIIFFTKYKYIKNWIPEKKRKNTLVVIGNGPSLKNEFDVIQQFVNSGKKEHDFICMNAFAATKYYEEIKPDKYIIVDPLFFKDTTNIEFVNITRNSTIKSLIDKTNWSVSLYVPRYYLKSIFVQRLSSNKYINIIPINNTPLSGGLEFLKHFLFKLNLGNPFGRNVMSIAIFLGIQKKYKNILLFGADHSWFNNLKVLPNNFITLDDKHINENDEDVIVLKDEDGKPKKLHVFIYQLYITFREYHVLNKYAKKNDIEILNMTNDSFIDAFKKSKQV